MIIKCKMCGGDIELSADKTYGTCDYCGSTMTFPKVDDDHRANLFNRANHFRRQNEFDKAVSAYERILNEDNTDAEAHWGVVLSRFGIEYVEDPVSHERIPTCHRVQVTSILTDADYLAALEFAPDSYSRDLYTAEAKRIADIQKGILAISAQEKPYDVFICYKETDEAGSRTKDSTIAQDIYYQLKQEGFNVFFARITLEDKLGQQYEPYIFAALNSAKVMLVVGTKPEHFNAVWVKNEWIRYLALMKQDRSRLLIPCYRDMDAYDLPDELSTLQSQDMSKIGFMQDLLRGVRKVLGVSQPQQPTPSMQAATAAPINAVSPLVKRIFMFLEDGAWASADEYCEKVLDLEPENAQAYLGKLMAGLKVHKREQLQDCAESFERNLDFQKALRFGDDALKTKLQEDIAKIKFRNEQARLESHYQKANEMMQRANSEDAFKKAASEFDRARDYKDAMVKLDKCLELAECARKEASYTLAKSQMSVNTEISYNAAIQAFRKIPGWKDADVLIPVCEQKILELREKAEEERLAQIQRAEQLLAERKRLAEEEQKRQEAARKRNILLGVAAVIAATIIAVLLMMVNANAIKEHYAQAEALLAAGDEMGALALYQKAGNYEDSLARQRSILASLDVKLDASRDNTLGLKKNGQVLCVGENEYKQCYPNAWDAVAVAAGNGFNVMLKTDGTVKANGYNEEGQCKVGSWRDIVAVFAGDYCAYGLKADGTVVAAGPHNGEWNDDGQYNVSDWKNIVSIAGGNSHTIGLKADGTVVAVGDNENGQCHVSGWQDIVAVSAGFEHTVGLKADGTVVAVGSNSQNQCNVSSWKDIVAISAGYHFTVGLKADGTVVAVGVNADGQCKVGSWKDIVAIAAGAHHTVGLKADGTVVAVGSKLDGKCDVEKWNLLK